MRDRLSAGGLSIQTGYGRAVTRVASIVRRIQRFGSGLASRLTLVQRFALISLVILVTGAFIIGRYVGGEIQDGVIARSSAIAALYVDSFISPHLQGLGSGAVSAEERSELDRLLADTSLGEQIMSFKVWDVQGEIVYASDPSLIGQSFDPHGGLAAALGGHVHAGLSDLGEQEHRLERLRWDRLLETYAPVREHQTGAIIGVMEFYQDPSDLESEIASSQREGWIIVGISTAAMYLVLVGLVKGASNTLARQHMHLGQLAQEKARLAQRVQKAAAEKTETDEQLMMRIGHGLHDGPVQDLGLALLRIKSLRQGTERRLADAGGEAERVREDFQLVETALADALKEVRQISADLHLPELAALTLPEVVEKAKLDYERKTGSTVAMDLGRIPAQGSVPLKIAVYRVLQEALNNSYRHAGGREQRMSISYGDGLLQLEVADGGPGFDPVRVEEEQDAHSGLGLRGMRERVGMLGGTMEITSSPASGTIVRVSLPLESETS